MPVSGFISGLVNDFGSGSLGIVGIEGGGINSVGTSSAGNLFSTKWESLLSGFLRSLGLISGNLSCNKWGFGAIAAEILTHRSHGFITLLFIAYKEEIDEFGTRVGWNPEGRFPSYFGWEA